MSIFSRALLAIVSATAGLAVTAPAFGHPHIFVDAKATVIFDAEGRARTLHNIWTFDEAYSAFAVQGLDADRDGILTREELQSMADDNVSNLAEFGFFSSAGIGNRNFAFTNGRNGVLDFTDRRMTLNFDIDFENPVELNGTLELGVSDPQYYVAIEFTDAASVRLIDAPAECTVELERPRPMSDELGAQLNAIPPDVTILPPALQAAVREVQGAILINCGLDGQAERIAEAESPLDAIDALTDVRPPQVTLAPAAVDIVGEEQETSWQLPVVLGALGIGLALLLAFLVRRRFRGLRSRGE